MRSLLLIAALAAGPSFAGDLVARQDGDSVRLQQKACPENVLAILPAEIREHFKLALVVHEGKEYRACFAVRADGMVVVQYPDGDGGLIPIRMFEMEPDA